jgi:hypothetical protein
MSAEKDMNVSSYLAKGISQIQTATDAFMLMGSFLPISYLSMARLFPFLPILL